MGSLDGVRILDLSTVMMGPTATQILASFGAEVIKVEPPEGDSMRAVGRSATRSMGPIFHNINHSKKSIVLDLKQDRARAALLRLAQTADVFVSNMRTDALARLGLTAEMFHVVNPRLLYVELSGFGRGGRYAGRPAYDDMIQAAAAIPSLLQISTGGEPSYVPMAIADRVVGIYAAGAIAAGLYQVARSGRGQSIEVPMFEVMTQFVLTDHLGGMTYATGGTAPGYMRLLSRGRRPFATLNGYLAVLPYSDQQWRRFLAAAGQPDRYNRDPRLHGMTARTEHIDALYAMLAEIIATNTTEYWIEVLEPLDVPVMRVHTLQTLRDDGHLHDVGFFQTVEHPADGPLGLMRCPSRWSETPARDPSPAPLLGQDTRSVLAGAGFGEDEVRDLTEARAVEATV